MGVDITDIGSPCRTTFRNSKGKIRAELKLPQHIIDEYGGGFIGLFRSDLYTRMMDAMPPSTMEFNKDVTEIHDKGSHVELTFADGATVTVGWVISADGIDSFVRAHLWGSEPKRSHNLQAIGGFTFDGPPDALMNEGILMYSRYVQGSYTSIISRGRLGHQWWIVEAWPDEKPAPENTSKHALSLDEGFSGPLKALIANTPAVNCQRWMIRDRVPMEKWSKGRASLAGDAAHATSPYDAYGAGMSICDGYFIAQRLNKVDFDDTEAVCKALAHYERDQLEHTNAQVKQAYILGQMFHHTPFPITWLRDSILDWTNLLQAQAGDKNPQDIIHQLSLMGNDILQPKEIVV